MSAALSISLLLALASFTLGAAQCLLARRVAVNPEPGLSVPELIHKMRKHGALFTVGHLLICFALPVSLAAAAKSFIAIPFFLLPVVIMITAGIYVQLMEKRVRRAEAPASMYLRTNFMGVFLCLSLYFFIFVSFKAIGALESLALPALGYSSNFLYTVAASIGKLAFGFLLFLTFYPWLMRFSLGLTDAPDSEQVLEIRATLRKVGLGHARLWLMHFDQMKFFNVLVWNHPLTKRIRPVIVMSKGLLDRLSREEIDAILCHEASHVALGHLAKRVYVVLACVALLIPVKLLALGAIALLTGGTPLWLVFFLAPLNFVIPLVVLSRVVWVQELQADAYAVFHFGAKPEAIESSLERLHEMNGLLKNRRDPSSYFNAAAAHPTLELRIASLQHAKERYEAGEPLFQWNDYITGSLRSAEMPRGADQSRKSLRERRKVS